MWKPCVCEQLVYFNPVTHAVVLHLRTSIACKIKVVALDGHRRLLIVLLCCADYVAVMLRCEFCMQWRDRVRQ